jgi:tetratricopeptide (TPR) repeat protein
LVRRRFGIAHARTERYTLSTGARSKERPDMNPRRILAVTAIFVALSVGSSARALAGTQSPQPAASPAAQKTGQPSTASASDLLSQAQADIAAGHNTTAREELRRAAAIDPGNLGIQKMLGDVEYRLENFPAAEIAYLAVLDKEPDNKDVHNRLGGVYAAEDRFDDALSEFRKSLPLREGFANLVQVYQDQGRLGELESEYMIEMEREPMEPGTHYNLGIVYDAEKNYAQAIDQYTTALDRNPRFTDALNALGVVFADEGRHQDAIARYQQTLDLDPRYYLALMNWGVELIKLGDYNGAIEKINKAIDINPQFPLSYENLGVAYDYLGDFTRAVELYQRTIVLDPGDRNVYVNLGAIYYNHGLLNLAEAAFIKGLATGAKNATLHFGLGDVYQQQRKYQLALAQFKSALAITPTDLTTQAKVAEMQAALAGH